MMSFFGNPSLWRYNTSQQKSSIPSNSPASSHQNRNLQTRTEPMDPYEHLKDILEKPEETINLLEYLTSLLDIERYRKAFLSDPLPILLLVEKTDDKGVIFLFSQKLFYYKKYNASLQLADFILQIIDQPLKQVIKAFFMNRGAEEILENILKRLIAEATRTGSFHRIAYLPIPSVQMFRHADLFSALTEEQWLNLFVWGIQAENVDLIVFLLDKNKSKRYLNRLENLTSVLIAAAERGNLEILKRLLLLPGIKELEWDQWQIVFLATMGSVGNGVHNALADSLFENYLTTCTQSPCSHDLTLEKRQLRSKETDNALEAIVKLNLHKILAELIKIRFIQSSIKPEHFSQAQAYGHIETMQKLLEETVLGESLPHWQALLEAAEDKDEALLWEIVNKFIYQFLKKSQQKHPTESDEIKTVMCWVLHLGYANLLATLLNFSEMEQTLTWEDMADAIKHQPATAAVLLESQEVTERFFKGNETPVLRNTAYEEVVNRLISLLRLPASSNDSVFFTGLNHKTVLLSTLKTFMNHPGFANEFIRLSSQTDRQEMIEQLAQTDQLLEFLSILIKSEAFFTLNKAERIELLSHRKRLDEFGHAQFLQQWGIELLNKRNQAAFAVPAAPLLTQYQQQGACETSLARLSLSTSAENEEREKAKKARVMR